MRPRGTGELASTELDPQGAEEEEGETRASLMNLERLRQFRVMRTAGSVWGAPSAPGLWGVHGRGSSRCWAWGLGKAADSGRCGDNR